MRDLTVNHIRSRGHGAHSKTPFEEDAWMVGRWRDGKTVSWDTYPTEAAALQAAGLSG